MSPIALSSHHGGPRTRKSRSSVSCRRIRRPARPCLRRRPQSRDGHAASRSRRWCSRGRARPLRRPAADSRLRRDLGPALPGRPGLAGRGCGARARVVRGLRRLVPRHLRQSRLPARMAGELHDHDGRSGGHAGLRRRRRRWHRPHGLGTLAGRHAAPVASTQADHLLRRSLLRLHAGARPCRPRGAHRTAAGARALRPHGRARRLRGRS